MTHTVSTAYAGLVSPSGIADDPTTITSAGLLDASLYTASLVTPWTITNAGGVLGDGITLASVGTTVSAGSFAGNTAAASGRSIVLDTGGSVTNQGSASISAYYGIYARNVAAIVVNTGAISGNTTSQFGRGIALREGGGITNTSGASIIGFDGIAIGIKGGVATIVNSGSITGNSTSASGKGINIRSGGIVTNQGGGVVSEYTRIFVSSGAATVANAGTISGSIDAVAFIAGQTNRLIIDQGVEFVGTVDGGNTIGAATVSTLQLASGASTWRRSSG